MKKRPQKSLFSPTCFCIQTELQTHSRQEKVALTPCRSTKPPIAKPQLGDDTKYIRTRSMVHRALTLIRPFRLGILLPK